MAERKPLYRDADTGLIQEVGPNDTVAGGGTTTMLRVNGGNASSQFTDYVLRFDFGANGANINPNGTA